MTRETDWEHMPVTVDGAFLVQWYCAHCGGREVSCDAAFFLNTGVVGQQDQAYCEDCGGETSTTDDRREAAKGRYRQLRADLDGCTCCAVYEPGEDPKHAEHCRARKRTEADELADAHEVLTRTRDHHTAIAECGCVVATAYREAKRKAVAS